MKFAPVALLFFLSSAYAASTSEQVTYDQTYDNSKGSMDSVACSNGKNGLAAKYPTFGALPDFPYIGGMQGVSWNSTKCGTCWSLTYKGNTINVLAIDVGSSGFNIALGAMNSLTNGQAIQLGRINADAVQVAKSNCGL